MRIWRICKQKYADQAYSGIGAKLYGGRWNEPGLAVVYTAGSLSLAALETFVHLDPDLLPDDLVAGAADLPAKISKSRLGASDLPSDWREYPAPDSIKQIGTNWLKRAKTAVLVVPSAIIPQERNYLINPAHKDFQLLKIHPALPFQFDSRMLK